MLSTAPMLAREGVFFRHYALCLKTILTCVFLLVFALINTSGLLAQATEDGPQQVPQGRLTDDIIPQHYVLDLQFDPSAERFSGEVEIKVMIEKPSNVIWLHGNGLDVEKVWLASENDRINARYEQVDKSGVAKLVLDQVPSLGPASLYFSYSAPYSSTEDGVYKVSGNQENYIFTQFQATSARRAFPSFDQPSFRTTFDISITAPEGQTVITATPKIGSEPASGNRVRKRFQQTTALPTYLISFAVGPFDIVEGPSLPATNIRARALPFRGIAPSGKGENLHYAMEHTRGIIEALESYFASPFPYPKLDIIAVPGKSGAMENVGAITYPEAVISVTEDASDWDKQVFATLHAHELAHQWFGNLVTIEWWDDIWLNEGFATWMGNKVVAGLPEYGGADATTRDSLQAMDADALASAREIRTPIKQNAEIWSAFDDINYKKSAAVIRMVELWMGPDRFRRAVQNHLEAFSNMPANADDFLQSLTRVPGGEQAGEVMQSFLSQPGTPLVDMSLTCARDRVQIKVQQERYLPLGAAANADKTWITPICFSYGQDPVADGASKRVCHVMRNPEDVITLAENTCPAWVNPNDKGAGYYRFSLDSDGWANLFDNFETLTEADARSILSNMTAAFKAGKISIGSMARAFKAFAQHSDQTVLFKPVREIDTIYNKLAADEPTRAGIEKFVRTLYQSRFAKLDEEAGQQEEDSLKTTLMLVLAAYGKDPTVRHALAADVGADLNEINPIPPALKQVALDVKVADSDLAFADHLFERVLASQDATFRLSALSALAAAPQAEIGVKLRSLLTSGALDTNEIITVALAQRDNYAQRDAFWLWLKANLDDFLNLLPRKIWGRIIILAEDFCTVDHAVDVENFFKNKVKNYDGGEISLNQTLDDIRSCAAIRTAKVDELREYFSDSD